MNSSKIKLSKDLDHCTQAFTAILLTLLIGLSSKTFADDTDIFLGGSSVASDVKPNVLFILDNSGSMLSQVYDERGNPTGETRMATMKQAVDDILANISGVNVGVMRFNGPGGSILFPVTDIDAETTASFITDSDTRNGEDDAVEFMDTGAVDLDEETLELAHVPNPNANGSVTAFLLDDDDDIEEYSSGSVPTGHFQFNMRSYQVNGLRYLNLDIPVGATIVDARLDFYSPFSASDHVHLQIQGQDEKDPARFTYTTNNVSDRLANSTTAVVDWEMTGFDPWVGGERYQSPNVAPILQEILDRPDWSPNDAVVFLVTQVAGTGQRAGTLRREDQPASQGPSGQGTLLHVTYTTAANATVDQMVGIRFPKVNIPKGASIVSARMDFTSAMSNVINPDSLNLRITAENTGNAEAFEETAYNLSSRPKYFDSVVWHPDDDWNAEEVVQGPDITDLVQEVVNHTSWCGNNAMAFYIQPNGLLDTNSRLAYATEAGLNRYPTLDIRYAYDPATAPPETGCQNSSLEFRVTESENDAQERKRKVDNNEDVIPIHKDYTNGFRFENVAIEQGAEILDAYLVFKAYPYGLSGFPGSTSDNEGSLTMQLWAHDTNDSAAFPQSRRNISRRSRTSASVNWGLDNWTGYDTYQSPDIKALIQEVVDRGSWSSGNALSIIQKASGSGQRGTFSFDGSVADSVKLVVSVASGGVQFQSNSVREYVRGLVQSMEANTWTPIVDSLYEASLYYRGSPLYYGKTRELMTQKDGYTDRRYKRVSVADSYTGGTHVMPSGCSENNLNSTNCRNEEITGSPQYISPINSDCQTSHIVLLTDGAANNNHSESLIRSLTGDTSCSTDSSRGGEKCGRTLARWLATNDHAPAFSNSTNNIQTHTIAFNLSSSNSVRFLEDLASEGSGSYHTANTASELTNAFDEIIRNIISIDATFVSPGATVNQFNRLTHRSEVYFSLFKPKTVPSWPGNLKRYKLLGDPAVLSDANDKAAIDENSGFFKTTSKSVWSQEVDGNNVDMGGAASQLPSTPDSRNLYTYIQSAGSPSKSLTHSSNRLHESNSDITTLAVGATTTSQREEVLQWARGVDLLDWDGDGNTNETRLQFGDPLHSVPQIVTYGGTETNPDTTIFFGTNEGFLHAINGQNGQEIFSFMPEALLGNLTTLYENNSTSNHPYGLDGSPEVWIKDEDGNGAINGSDHVYIYIGMRRGGRNLYALDVTNRNSPKILWTIEGGTGDFTDLAQTWSKPVHAKVKINSLTEMTDVLIFGGGFDPAQDNALARAPDSIGAAVYMVNAETGDLIWSASASASSSSGLNLTDMIYSIPSDVAVIETSSDGAADSFFVGDMGGQVWRFDIHNGESVSNLVTGGKIADIAGSANTEARRFFNEPDISVFSTRENGMRLAISMGSGTRFDPLNRVIEDKFYVFYQNSIFVQPTSYTTITESDLEDRTGNLAETLISGSGWYTRFPNEGEKVLAASLTINNKIIFTTYQPDSAASACSAVIGTGRVYVVDLLTGQPGVNLEGEQNEELSSEDFSIELSSGSIPPAPKMLFPNESSPVVLIGPEQPLQNVNFGVANEWKRSYWYEAD